MTYGAYSVSAAALNRRQRFENYLIGWLSANEVSVETKQLEASVPSRRRAVAPVNQVILAPESLFGFPLL